MRAHPHTDTVFFFAIFSLWESSIRLYSHTECLRIHSNMLPPLCQRTMCASPCGSGGGDHGSSGRAAVGSEGCMAEPAPPSEPEQALLRCLPRCLPRRRSDIYVNMKADFQAQVSRCQKLLAPGGGCTELCIHGLGLAIHRAIIIALELEAMGGGALEVAANTSDQLADAAEPEDDWEEPHNARHNSAIHIRVLRAAPE